MNQKIHLFACWMAACFFLQPLLSFTQDETSLQNYPVHPLTIQEELQLMALPVLKVPPGYVNRDLPPVVDNSTQPYMRPVFNQDQYCCGQAACIGYNFTYEIDRARNLPANVPQNQYPTHFSWNFANGGNGWYGVSFLESLQILKEYGMPNVVDYGGTLSYGGPTRWMSGYTQYYNGMHNRITEAYQLIADDYDGLQVLKGWLYDHLENAAVGGVASFYAQYMSASNTLPAGTPEAGKYVLTTFGGSANHAMTIVGYNDSIRWDYNSDGQYTNNLDINGDGDVNLQDCEIGGFKMVQSYGGVPNWGNQGYAYMMYKTVADDLGAGGIWNHSIYMLDVKQNCDPQLTARVILKHTSRDKIKVIAGISNNTTNSMPEVTIGYHYFDYQGGNFYMQGGTTEDDKTIELGLDLSPLLTYAELGQDVKIFLQVVEKDPDNVGAGEIVHFSIYDHTSGGNEYTCTQSHVPIFANDTTTMSIMHTFSFDRIHVEDETLPPAPVGQYYSHQMTASGGSAPYFWNFDKSYAESNQNATFPMITAVQLFPSNNNSGIVTQEIGFDFPFYDSSYSSITLHVDGYLMFDEQLYPYPYFIDDKTLFTITKNISPFMNQNQVIVSGSGGLWYEGDANSATFRWKTADVNNTSNIFNYAVKLYPDGKIEYYYGSMTGCSSHLWLGGISDGDNVNYQQIAISNLPAITANTMYKLLHYQYPSEMTVSEDGLFSGTPQQAYAGVNINFKVTDNSFISSVKSLTLSSNGVIVLDSISAGDDDVIEFNEDVLMSVKLTNIETAPINNAELVIHINDDYVTVSDSTQSLGTLLPGTTVRFVDAFNFQVAPDIPDNHLINIETVITAEGESWESTLFHYAYAAVVQVSGVVVNDDDGHLDPGETTDITVSYTNNGGAEVESMYAILNSTDPVITINLNFGNIAYLAPGLTEELTYNVTVADDAMNGDIAEFTVSLMGDNNYSGADSFNLPIGMFCENFESGDFSQFDWGFDGNRDWQIDDQHVFNGFFSGKSGYIIDNQESILMIDIDVQSDGDISFYKKVSCEDDTSAANNYDYLGFYIDGGEIARWDGDNDWSLFTYPVTAGFHRFEWRYHKDYSVSSRHDAAWLDNISFPSPIEASPYYSLNTEVFEMMLRPEETAEDTLTVTNNAAGNLEFRMNISGIDPANSGGGGGGGRNLEGSYIICDVDYFHLNQTCTWTLIVYNTSEDSEWIKDIFIEFPAGMELVTATDFTGGTLPLLFVGPLGNGVTANWHGEDQNGWGVIHGGQTATCTLTVFTYEELTGSGSLSYEVHGDIYGTPPHVISGTIPLRNFGPVISWLTLNTYNGIIPGQSFDDIILSYNTAGMADGEYLCWLVLDDNFQHETFIPVTLTVDQFLSSPVEGQANAGINIYPNPFREQTMIGFILPGTCEVAVDLFDLKGEPVRSLIRHQTLHAGKYQITWNGKDDQGALLAAGIYIVMITQGESSFYSRIILLR